VRAKYGKGVNALERYLERHILAGRSSRRALLTIDGAYTYGELHEQVQRASRVLCEAGVSRGDRVVIVLPDSPVAVAFLLGAMGIGAVPILIPSSLSEEDHAFVCADCEPVAAIVGEIHADSMSRIRRAAGRPKAIFVAPGVDGLREDLMSADAALAGAEPQELVMVSPDDIALVQYTSGSTGRPKGVVHLHRGLLALPDGFGRRLALSDTDLCYSTAKLSFGYGLGNSVFFPLDAGAASFLRAAPSDPLGTLETIQTVAPTVVFAGPTLYRAIAAISGVEEAFDLSSVRLYVSAGDVLSPSLFREWEARFGHGLGSTECLHIFMAGQVGALRPGSLGETISPYRARLIREDGGVPPPGEPGHLEISGPANGVRYWNRPKETETTMVGGWIRTGDMLAQETDRTFRYIGRRDDVFKVREMKVSPMEIEEQLNSHPAVIESAVVGRADVHGLTVVCAYIHASPDHQPGPDLARELRACLRASSLSPHKLPRIFEFVDALPRTSTGKLARQRLRHGPVPVQGR
jgi:benzoate-CoA ligase family protein